MTSDFHSGLPTNILRGIVPVASVWGTNPTNLANCTDGDMSTVTGTGSKVMGGAGDYGTLVFDLGSIKTVVLAGRIGVWSTAGVLTVMPESSDDNITFRGSGINTDSRPLFCYTTAAAEKIFDCQTVVVTGRYIRIRFYVGAASTASGKIYSVMAYELGL